MKWTWASTIFEARTAYIFCYRLHQHFCNWTLNITHFKGFKTFSTKYELWFSIELNRLCFVAVWFFSDNFLIFFYVFDTFIILDWFGFCVILLWITTQKKLFSKKKKNAYPITERVACRMLVENGSNNREMNRKYFSHSSQLDWDRYYVKTSTYKNTK